MPRPGSRRETIFRGHGVRCGLIRVSLPAPEVRVQDPDQRAGDLEGHDPVQQDRATATGALIPAAVRAAVRVTSTTPSPNGVGLKVLVPALALQAGDDLVPGMAAPVAAIAAARHHASAAQLSRQQARERVRRVPIRAVDDRMENRTG